MNSAYFASFDLMSSSIRSCKVSFFGGLGGDFENWHRSPPQVHARFNKATMQTLLFGVALRVRSPIRATGAAKTEFVNEPATSGSDPPNLLRAARGARRQGRSRPSPCLGRAFLVRLHLPHLVLLDAFACRPVLNRNLNGELNRGNRASFR